MKTALLIMLLVVAGCASVPEGLQDDGTYVYRMQPDQVARCKREGSCFVVTQELLKAMLVLTCGKDI